MSHYCRKDSERLYLGASLKLATMYRLYCETRHKEQAVTIASSTVYCELFRTEFNLGFHNPSKDRCDFCVSFENLSLDEKNKQKHLYDDHHRNKARVQEKKIKDKEESRTNKKKLSVCFDLQEVFMTPHSNASVLYYKRKLNTFNLSLYDLGSGQAVCNVWHEGHSKNENDSVHATIERVSKHLDIYTTPHWAGVISAAKRTKSHYIVKELDEHCFFDFKQVAGHLKNFDLDVDRQKVQWLNIKSMKITKESPNIVHILYDYDARYHQLNLAQRIRKVQHSVDFHEIKLDVLNFGKGPGIDKDKYDDL
ncbi:tRNA uridine 5-carboxymethylaminomethyl modification enzyme mnmg [Plakobranchus ocellatus]|uniref:tRNA uridine 5-carboxymethylaminomethyl modification enzyme mnmg n=1 Tax=Plakobranchus ocellatus TaxID=259542 RepID=A0AAV4DUS7_9GAST|nr:tRNA uridine 5-carboxymethylaminomethyl modification enzyme mnmg [Plakobranchus ocellatus]